MFPAHPYAAAAAAAAIPNHNPDYLRCAHNPPSPFNDMPAYGSRNVFDQPSLLLSPGTHFNPGKPSSLRNPVPLDAPRDEPESLASAVAARFDGVSVDGKSIVIPAGGAEDNFKGCAQGASALVNMSDFLLDAAGPAEQGASRWVRVTHRLFFELISFQGSAVLSFSGSGTNWVGQSLPWPGVCRFCVCRS